MPVWQWQQATPPGPRSSLKALLDLLGDGLPPDIRHRAATLPDEIEAEELLVDDVEGEELEGSAER